jgi:hypothetical protein
MSARTKGWAIALPYFPRPRSASANDTADGVICSSCLRVCTRQAQARKLELVFRLATEAPRRWQTAALMAFECFKISQRCADRRRTGSPRQPWPEVPGQCSAQRGTCSRCQPRKLRELARRWRFDVAQTFRGEPWRELQAEHSTTWLRLRRVCISLLKRPTFEVSGRTRYSGGCSLDRMVRLRTGCQMGYRRLDANQAPKD